MPRICVAVKNCRCPSTGAVGWDRLAAQGLHKQSQGEGLWGREGCDEPSVTAGTIEGDGDKPSGVAWHRGFDDTSCSGRKPCQRLVAFSLLGPCVLKQGSLLHFFPCRECSSE